MKHKVSRNLAFIATAFAMLVIMLGAFTRLADAGLGCPDWPGCYGHILWPNEAHEVIAANEVYPDMPVDHDKTWPEMVHRYLATGLGLFAIALVFLASRYRDEAKPFKHAWFLLALIILQGLFGMWTVTLKLWPQVVTTHLLGGFLSFNLLWLLGLRLSGWQLVSGVPIETITLLKKVAFVALFMVFVQIALGGWTTSNYAAVACPGFPTCQQQWLPAMDMVEGFNIFQHIGPNYLGGMMDNDARVAIHMMHRLGAILCSLAIIVLVVSLVKAGLRRFSMLIAGILSIQVFLGISNIIFHFPISVAVAHNLGGALLAAAVVFVLYGLYTAKENN